jgi:uncharacterized protein YndB with AHSA1/START domain
MGEQSTNKIKVPVTVNVQRDKAWMFYTLPEHITQWNFAHPSWHCPSASNDVRVGGKYVARMEARDGSSGFDFEAVYVDVNDPAELAYEFGGRLARVTFGEQNGQTTVTIVFDPETENPIELQRQGWQAILDSYKCYTESN